MPKLSIGTAQFGMKYGITNKNGAITEKEVHEILELCDISVMGQGLPHPAASKRSRKVSEPSH